MLQSFRDDLTSCASAGRQILSGNAESNGAGSTQPCCPHYYTSRHAYSNKGAPPQHELPCFACATTTTTTSSACCQLMLLFFFHTQTHTQTAVSKLSQLSDALCVRGVHAAGNLVIQHKEI